MKNKRLADAINLNVQLCRKDATFKSFMIFMICVFVVLTPVLAYLISLLAILAVKEMVKYPIETVVASTIVITIWLSIRFAIIKAIQWAERSGE